MLANSMLSAENVIIAKLRVQKQLRLASVEVATKLFTINSRTLDRQST